MRPPPPPLGKVSFARVLARLHALGGLGLAPELVVPEMCILLSRTLQTVSYPAVFVTPPDVAMARPHDFTVWLGAEGTVRELRASLKLGIWPGPKDTPSLQTIMTQRENRRVFAATLWGEGCIDEGPWGDMWRARGIQQGIQTVFFAPSGKLTAVAVMARGTGEPIFTNAEIAFAEASVPIIAAALDGAPGEDAYDSPVPESQLVLDADGKAGPMSFGVAELLSDMGGGGPDAVEAITAKIEQLATTIEQGPAYDVAGDPFVHMRRVTRGNTRPRGATPLEEIVLTENALGRFSARFSPLAGEPGGTIATLRRRVPAALLAARGALSAGASARELELAVALTRGETLDGAAARLGVGLSSVKTLLERLIARLDATSRTDAMTNLLTRGRAASW
ncbi:hypothetical protein sos41_21780 [Alphaproteobacteria bacterium SO-S41]|nr:hypothetical protein sos41_21780 [Alphaproteobacteria bacterium SO-S41]